MKKINVFIREDLDKLMQDKSFVKLVHKYASQSEEFNRIKIDRRHDKVFKRVFSNKQEATYFVNKTLNINLKPNELVLSQNSFVTSELKYREADIVYKLKNRNIYFLIEQQTRVDYHMPFKILNYQLEIMRANRLDKPSKYDKEILVISIVLYTGKGKWNAEKYIRKAQEKLSENMKIEKGDTYGLGNYNLVDVNNFTKEELLNDKSILSKIMLIEKVANTQELIQIMFKINSVISNSNKDEMQKLMQIILAEKIGIKKAEEIINKMRKKGSGSMLAVEEMIHRENKMFINKGKVIGIKAGMKKGAKQKQISIAKKLLHKNYNLEDIKDITELDRKTIEKLKKQL